MDKYLKYKKKYLELQSAGTHHRPIAGIHRQSIDLLHRTPSKEELDKRIAIEEASLNTKNEKLQKKIEYLEHENETIKENMEKHTYHYNTLMKMIDELIELIEKKETTLEIISTLGVKEVEYPDIKASLGELINIIKRHHVSGKGLDKNVHSEILAFKTHITELYESQNKEYTNTLEKHNKVISTYERLIQEHNDTIAKYKN
jgi:chromosome segregation ATPase